MLLYRSAYLHHIFILLHQDMIKMIIIILIQIFTSSSHFDCILLHFFVTFLSPAGPCCFIVLDILISFFMHLHHAFNIMLFHTVIQLHISFSHSFLLATSSVILAVIQICTSSTLPVTSCSLLLAFCHAYSYTVLHTMGSSASSTDRSFFHAVILFLHVRALAFLFEPSPYIVLGHLLLITACFHELFLCSAPSVTPHFHSSFFQGLFHASLLLLVTLRLLDEVCSRRVRGVPTECPYSLPSVSLHFLVAAHIFLLHDDDILITDYSTCLYRF